LQVLSDDEKKSLYDKYGEAGLKGAGMGMGVSKSLMILGKSNLFITSSTFSQWDKLHDRISAILLICLSHYLKAWVAWAAWAAELLGVERLMARMNITILS
jgi:hypothetical protein